MILAIKGIVNQSIAGRFRRHYTGRQTRSSITKNTPIESLKEASLV